LAKELTISPNSAEKYGLHLNHDGVLRSVYELLSYPNIRIEQLEPIWPELGQLDKASREALEIEAQYAVYMDRQQNDIIVMEREERLVISAKLVFSSISVLSNEFIQKLKYRQLQTITEAQLVDGMTPAAVALLISQIKKQDVRERQAVQVIGR